ncbi:MAG: hypothetical protein IPP19_00015 [Verrucomicrobia bacterium]|nr:hypothetical protein [Verrucomicrobiota bacterium]
MHNYDGTVKTAAVTPSVAGTMYAADLTRGPAAGSYTVTATALGDYTGSGSAVLVINPPAIIDQAVLTLVAEMGPAQTYNTSQTLTVTGGSGSGAVSYSIVNQSAAGVATLSGAVLTANTGTGWVDVQASKAGSGNYNAATSAAVRVTFKQATQATLSFSAIANQTYNTSQTLTVTGGSGSGAVSYSIVNQSAAGVATLSGAVLTANTGTGWVDVQATKALDGNYSSATSAIVRVDFKKADQAAFNLVVAQPQVCYTTQKLSFTGGSSYGAVSYAIVNQSSASGVATLSTVLEGPDTPPEDAGTFLTANAATGWVDVQATRAADLNYNAASSTVRVNIAKLDQGVVSVSASANQTYNTSQTLTITGGSGSGAVSYSIVNQSAAGVATLSGAVLTANTGTGWVDVQATKAESINYNPATSATVRVTFKQATQATLSLSAIANQTYNTSQTLTATGGSGTGAVSYSIVNQSAAGVATLSGAVLTANTGTGWVDVQAAKTADTNYNGATSATVRVTFQKPTQATLSFSAIANQTYNTSQTLTVTGGSGSGAVSYSIVNQSAAGVATLSGAVFTAKTGTGWVDVQASKAGDGSYSAVTSAIVRVTFTKADQAAFNLVVAQPQVYYTTQKLSFTGGSSYGAVTYAIVNQSSASGVATLSTVLEGPDTPPENAGTFLTANVATGWVDVQATKAADLNYNAASSTVRVNMTKLSQGTVSLSASANQTYNTSQTLSITGGLIGGVVSYAVVNQSAAGVATLSGAVLTANTGTGWVDVQATKAESSNYFGATTAIVRVTFKQATQTTLGLTASATQTYNMSQTFGASGGNGTGAVSYTIVNQSAAGVATLSGAVLTAKTGTGWVDVQASKAADSNYAAATSATARVTFKQATQTTLGLTASATQTYNASQTLSITGGLGAGAVSYTIINQSAAGVATLSGAVLTAKSGTGWVDVQATKAADSNYNAATSATVRVTLQQATQATLGLTASATQTNNTSQTLGTSGGTGSGAGGLYHCQSISSRSRDTFRSCAHGKNWHRLGRCTGDKGSGQQLRGCDLGDGPRKYGEACSGYRESVCASISSTSRNGCDV